MSVNINSQKIGATIVVDDETPSFYEISFDPTSYTEASNILNVRTNYEGTPVEGHIYKIIINYESYPVDVRTEVSFDNFVYEFNPANYFKYKNDVRQAFEFYALFLDGEFKTEVSVDYMANNYLLDGGLREYLYITLNEEQNTTMLQDPPTLTLTESQVSSIVANIDKNIGLQMNITDWPDYPYPVCYLVPNYICKNSLNAVSFISYQGNFINVTNQVAYIIYLMVDEVNGTVYCRLEQNATYN